MLAAELVSQLDQHDVRPLIEYVAARLHADAGERQIRFDFSDGNLRRSRLDAGPIGNEELERIAALPSS